MIWVKLWGWIQAAWSWLVKHPVAIISALAAAAGAYFMWLSNKNKIASLEEAVEVQGAKAKIAKSETEAKMLAKRGEEHTAEAVKLEEKIKQSKRRVVEINEGESLEGKTDDEIADLFNKAGF